MLSSPFEKLNKQITNTKAISDLHYLTNKTQKLIKIHCYILKILFKRGVNLFDIGVNQVCSVYRGFGENKSVSSLKVECSFGTFGPVVQWSTLG